MKGKYKKARRIGSYLILNGERSVRPAGEPKRLSVRFEEEDSKAQDVVILMRASAPVASGLPERLRHCIALAIGIFLLAHTASLRADDKALEAKHENMKRFFDAAHPPPPPPTLAEIKQAAEKGDAAAQVTYADSLKKQKDFSTALVWYRKAADQGNSNGQFNVGEMLLVGHPSSAVSKDSVPMDLNEAVLWLCRAANQGQLAAEVTIGRCYVEGVGVDQDFVEASKWFILAAKQTNTVASDAIKDLSRKMRADEITAAKLRAEAFVPGQAAELPVPLYLTKLKLNGITGSGPKRFAIVNNHTLALNEVTDIKLDTRNVEVKCVEIDSKSVVLRVGPYRKELQYHD